MNPNITISLVEKFQIYENYEQRFPSSHLCKIYLTNGQKAKKCLDGMDIYILIKAIAKDKITFKRTKCKEELSWKPQSLDTFNSYAKIPYSAFRVDKSTVAPLPDELIQSFFEGSS